MGVTSESPLMDLHFHDSRFRKDLNSLSYLVDLSPGIQAPDILFATPALFEVYGGGFDKAPGCRVRMHANWNVLLSYEPIVLSAALATNQKSLATRREELGRR